MCRCWRIILLGVALMAPGCQNAPPEGPGAPAEAVVGRPIIQLELRAAYGAAHGPLLVRDGVWYQIRGTRIVIVDPETLAERGGVELGGRATVLLDHGAEVIALVPGRGIVRLVETNDRQLAIEEVITDEILGATPVSLSVAEDLLYACGTDAGGAGLVVRVHDREVVYRVNDRMPTSVVTIASGNAVIVGRRVHRIEDDRFLGSASQLIPIPRQHPMALPDIGMDLASFIFLRKGTTTTVGLMDSALRESHRNRLTVEISETVRRIVLVEDRIWVIGESVLWSYGVISGRMHLTDRIDLPTVIGLAGLDQERLVLSSPGVRAVYRWHGARSMQRIHRVPARLEVSAPAGRTVLAAGAGITWRYDPVRDVLEEAPPAARPPVRQQHRAETRWGAATIGADSQVLLGSNWSWREPRSAVLACVVAINGQLWVGHDHGITVLASGETGVRAVASIDTGGGVDALYPLLDGSGAVFVGFDVGLGVVGGS